MKNFIHEHFKGFIGITALIVCTIALIGSNELIAKLLPDAQDLTVVSWETKNGDVYAYTGEEIAPEFSKFVFEDKDGNEVEVLEDKFAVHAYMDNVELGFADIEIALDDYRNSIVLEDVFEIVLGRVDDLQVAKSSKKSVMLTWDKVTGADGYIVLKSKDNGKTFTEVKNVVDSLSYKDKKIKTNSVYVYQVKAYVELDGEIVYGETSESIKHVTPLANIKVKEASKVDSDSIEVVWEEVKGAASYQVFKSAEKDGTYEMIGEVSEETSFVDDKCEVGVEYFYYVVACQQIEDELYPGKPSKIVSEATTPDEARLNGSTNSDKTSASLTWKEVEGADGYEIYKKSESGDFKLVETVSKDTLSWKDSDLKDTKEYDYKVRAYVTVDGEKVYGSYSGTYEKEKKVNYKPSAGSVSGGTGDITKYEGYSYKFGGTTTSGWDCSGFTSYVMRNEYGVEIARTAAGQASGGQSVSVSDRSQWKAGDILCYKNNGSYNHVAIYLGNGMMIHALNDKHDTLIQSVDAYEGWDDNNLASVKRY